MRRDGAAGPESPFTVRSDLLLREVLKSAIANPGYSIPEPPTRIISNGVVVQDYALVGASKAADQVAPSALVVIPRGLLKL